MSSSSSTANFHPDGTLIIVSGPSGAGKTTLVNSVRDYFRSINHTLHFSVSHTTRAARAGEVDGVNYYYVSDEVFDRMVDRGEFLEWAHVHGHRYGTSRLEVEQRLARQQDVILDIDVQGAQLISENAAIKPRSVSVFVIPQTFEELEKRIRDRGLNTEFEIDMRLKKAYSEIEQGFTFYDYVIINDDVAIAAECLRAAIIAKKLKSSSALEKLRERAMKFKEVHSGRSTRGC
jgi:guanylate kinase